MAEQLAGATEALRARMDTAAQGASLQTETADTTATGMEQMNASIAEAAEGAADSARFAQRTKEVAEEGGRVLKETVRKLCLAMM